ncbi:MAG: radical SAM protein [Proteobacteria bacterium]|nr:radical SAM protein [Pseudomonadota bacterium]
MLMAKPSPNSNFNSLSGVSVHDTQNPAIARYRDLWHSRPKTCTPGSFPLHLDLEITSRCNLKCTFCDKLPVLGTDQIGDMDLKLFQHIIDQGTESGLASIKLSYRGEPLLHPKIAEMVSYAKSRGILDVYFNSNGMLLTNTKAQSLIDAGLDRISISIEGTNPAAFEAARRGARFEKIKNNVRELVRLRDANRLAHPKVRIQTVSLPGIDLDEYAEYWGPFCDETAAIDYKDCEKVPDMLVHEGFACPQLWQRMTIEWNGIIHPCNNDDTGRFALGNASSQDLQSLWLSPKVQEARELHQEGKSHMVEACRVCPWRATQIAKLCGGNLTQHQNM